ncbi:hypothetical protein CEUSTIGMA_g3385.t1 [Chlamydomonas eustigma]|uniref:Uncharacterized protein n=1 Tax=Chlamydomonas eustigma TaxID=1157962 RepID=A0A250WZ99_9CHLO|nr:hypothetical protein CEUSTIGMA_g3385.t1 [Chlamydomonas eustigma]|eukprot:GAX75942.1 hypothetical protein CEUSTIGMA_g3385.t1 [Chlamydomonas eustigma]
MSLFDGLFSTSNEKKLSSAASSLFSPNSRFYSSNVPQDSSTFNVVLNQKLITGKVLVEKNHTQHTVEATSHKKDRRKQESNHVKELTAKRRKSDSVGDAADAQTNISSEGATKKAKRKFKETVETATVSKEENDSTALEPPLKRAKGSKKIEKSTVLKSEAKGGVEGTSGGHSKEKKKQNKQRQETLGPGATSAEKVQQASDGDNTAGPLISKERNSETEEEVKEAPGVLKLSPEEEPEKLERTLFVGNFPIKKNAKDQLKEIFSKYVNCLYGTAGLLSISANATWKRSALNTLPITISPHTLPITAM